MTDVVVAGSGRCGLHVARMLAERGFEVTVVERLPQVGGQEPERDARSLERAARRAGVKLMLGTLVVSHVDGVVHTLGIDGASAVPVKALVLATGTRPQTRAELGIGGDRGAGVTPGSAAVHFLDSGLLLGRNPVVVGGGELAHHLCNSLLRKGARQVTSVTDGPRNGSWPRVTAFDDARVVRVNGFPRVHSVVIETYRGAQEVTTDAVILASGRVPMRNIEGALYPSDSVHDCFGERDPRSDEEAVQIAEATARAVVSAIR
jgi:NADPH-dependent 2,4-dienoyl-CoA reductase/sulfur reductase-like enzyme